MNTFSVLDCENLSDSQGIDFNKALELKLSALLNDIITDDVLDATTIKELHHQV